MSKKTILEMFNEIKKLEVADGPETTVEDILPFFCESVEKALHRLEAIDNANPSEALECLKNIGELCYIEADNLDESIFMYANQCQGFDTIKNYILKVQELERILDHERELNNHLILKAQEQAKDKVFLKNIGNTKVRVPLVSIFNGLTQEKKFAYTEHIYYHWEEMKENLEAEIKTIKTEKENLELKAKEQEKVLEIIFEKSLNIPIFKEFIRLNKPIDYMLKRFNQGREKKNQFTEEEFELLKRWYNGL